MLAVRPWWLAALAGCGFNTAQLATDGRAPSDGEPDVDAAVDGPIDPPIDGPPNGVPCYGTGLTAICLDPAPPPSIMLDNTTIDTGSDARCLPAVGAYCALAADRIEVRNTVTAVGPRPLVLVGIDRIEVTGTLDASSRLGAPPGAGANHAQCASAAGGTNGGRGGGGAGGSFGGGGGSGGSGNGGGAAAGIPSGAIGAFNMVRGGCRGGAGGASADGAGAGGSSGGAIYLISDDRIEVSGNIFASGAAGTGGPRDGGGGGGGSGGLIGLDAPSIVMAGRLVANAGGGGGGGGNATSGNGDDGSTVDPTLHAPGGTASIGGGVTGGAGTAGAILDGGPGGSGNRGGGGGGGGAGIIRIYPAQSLAGAVSPDPS